VDVAGFILILLTAAISHAMAIALAACLAPQQHPANRYLAAVMVVLAIGLVGEVLRMTETLVAVPVVYALASATPFLIGPYLLGYARQTTTSSPVRLSRWHFVPTAAYLAAIGLTSPDAVAPGFTLAAGPVWLVWPLLKLGALSAYTTSAVKTVMRARIGPNDDAWFRNVLLAMLTVFALLSADKPYKGALP
jgi:hypothetical protein